LIGTIMSSSIPTLTRCAALSLITALTAGCQSTTPPKEPPPAAASISYTPSTFHMPTGSGCQGDIDRWIAIQNNDLQMGHVTRSIYDQIQAEIKTAQASCASGHDAEASAMVAASKHRHGYPN
jgi:hypothetical protein